MNEPVRASAQNDMLYFYWIFNSLLHKIQEGTIELESATTIHAKIAQADFASSIAFS